MKIRLSKSLILLVIASALTVPANAESLFRTGISQNVYPINPRPLYGTVKARSIGDLVTIIINEQIKTSDTFKLNLKKTSDTTDNFSPLVNKLIPRSILPRLPKDIDGFGGSNTVGNSATSERQIKFVDKVTTQVVQVLPNGNLVVQGKKSSINADEKTDLVISGVVDPRFLDYQGKIDSSLVANLQIAVVGKGTVSRANNEGTVNKFIRYLF